MNVVSPLVDHFLKNDYARDYTGAVAENCKSVYLSFRQLTNDFRLFFNPDSELDGENATIKAIEIVNVTTNAVSIGGPVATDMLTTSLLSNGYLVLAKTDEQLAFIPLVPLIRNANSGKFCFFHSTLHVWQDSYIVFTDVSGLAASNSMWIRVWYDKN